jgi:hypothetical protein
MQAIPPSSTAGTAGALHGATASSTVRGEAAAAARAGEPGRQRAVVHIARAGAKIS